METTPETWLGEALASYQPQKINPAVWQRLLPDVEARTAERGFPDWETARPHVARLAGFLGDVTAARPDARLDEVLTSAVVASHLGRLAASGASAGSVGNVQGTLNGYLNKVRYRPQRSRRAVESPGQATGLASVLAQAAVDGSDAALHAARLVLLVLPDVAPVTEGLALPCSVGSSDGEVVVDGVVAAVPFPVPTVPVARVGPSAARRAREWALQACGADLSVRALRMARIELGVESVPAAALLSIDGIGRKALSDAVSGARRPQPAEVARLLRGTPGPG